MVSVGRVRMRWWRNGIKVRLPSAVLAACKHQASSSGGLQRHRGHQVPSGLQPSTAQHPCLLQPRMPAPAVTALHIVTPQFRRCPLLFTWELSSSFTHKPERIPVGYRISSDSFWFIIGTSVFKLRYSHFGSRTPNPIPQDLGTSPALSRSICTPRCAQQWLEME